MKYTFSAVNPANHFLSVSAECFIDNLDKVLVQLPSWRPGRYELGNFAKNIKDFVVKDQNGEVLIASKTTKDTWQVECKNTSKLLIEYDYYAAELNAGATWLDENQLYVNPVNCCVYVVGKEEEGCELLLDIPDNYLVATSLMKETEKKLLAVDFQELADSPFIASPTLQHKIFESENITFHIWFQGVVKPNWDQLLSDFQRFTDYQIEVFGGFPAKEYHFLNQITTYKAYHGVEHQKSTVIALGPSYDVFKDLYTEFLGVSSHELYHAWNIKAIRPKEMMPYDFSKENYSKLGYVAEGVTTYMGDRILFESGVFDLIQYLKEFETYLLRHFHNDGRMHYSVADSSWDTWLDGYVPGVPGRKTSIYTEGALIAYICDMRIRKATNGTCSLHTAMRELYEFIKENGSYTEQDYQAILERVSGVSFEEIFKNLIYGTEIFTPYLTEAWDFEGWEMQAELSKLAYENFGIKGAWNGSAFQVLNIKEGSAADLSELVVNDLIHSVNGVKLNDDLSQWITYFEGEELNLSIERNGMLKKITLLPQNEQGYFVYKMFVK